jgi:uncharacterized protein (TIGR03437 family)
LGQVLAANDDDVLNGPVSPASPGSVITLYVTGEGQTTPAGSVGRIATGALPRPILPVTATIGGRDATVKYAGAAQGMVAGIMQVDLEVPNGTPAGTAVPIVVKVGDASSPEGVTVAVGEK